MGKYQLDYKGQQAVAKFHEKQTPAKFDKKKQLEKMRAEYLKKMQKQTDK
ncbi:MULTISPECIES: hypothetical protein [unclassified Bacillus (in: firmicutes)]|nr:MULTISPECIES: hypothetical protein [unclassified Bacillus (in: firmicutes)]PEJ56940.1 hypothetical protein CN692_15260 [Bacillus sp. AFS002410]PEL11328.1 hypothetical protein CN601_11330 [Bacillus sp. AFS017336]